MATSGTVGLTSISTAKLLERACRRCGLLPERITPEVVDIALNGLFMLIMRLSNRGLNLWCIDHKLLPVTPHQASYTLPAGTLDVLNISQCTPTPIAFTGSAGVGYYQATLSEASSVVRYGVKYSSLPTTPHILQKSEDGVSWTDVQTETELPQSGMFGWYEVDPSVTAGYFRISTLGTVAELYLASSIREVPLAPFNRDDYANQVNKRQESLNTTSYFFEKLVDPRITYWPVPADEYRHMAMFRYRQIQDVGTLTQNLEIPNRWLDPIVWQLSATLAYDLPGVDPKLRQEILMMAQNTMAEVEAGETDSAPVYIYPNIGVYTR